MALSMLDLSWENHNEILTATFQKLLVTESLVDCTLAAEGKFLKAHKIVLAACSPYLEAILNQENDKHPIIILKDVEFQDLKAIVEIVYFGKKMIPETRLLDFLSLAEDLQIKFCHRVDNKGFGQEQSTEESEKSVTTSTSSNNQHLRNSRNCVPSCYNNSLSGNSMLTKGVNFCQDTKLNIVDKHHVEPSAHKSAGDASNPTSFEECVSFRKEVGEQITDSEQSESRSLSSGVNVERDEEIYYLNCNESISVNCDINVEEDEKKTDHEPARINSLSSYLNMEIEGEIANESGEGHQIRSGGDREKEKNITDIKKDKIDTVNINADMKRQEDGTYLETARNHVVFSDVNGEKKFESMVSELPENNQNCCEINVEKSDVISNIEPAESYSVGYDVNVEMKLEITDFELPESPPVRSDIMEESEAKCMRIESGESNGVTCNINGTAKKEVTDVEPSETKLVSSDDNVQLKEEVSDFELAECVPVCFVQNAEVIADVACEPPQDLLKYGECVTDDYSEGSVLEGSVAGESLTVPTNELASNNQCLGMSAGDPVTAGESSVRMPVLITTSKKQPGNSYKIDSLEIPSPLLDSVIPEWAARISETSQKLVEPLDDSSMKSADEARGNPCQSSQICSDICKLTYHVRSDHEKSVYECKLCLKSFSNSVKLKRHLSFHVGEKEFQCSLCSERFSESQDLETHFNIHIHKKKNQCKICSKRFSQPQGLKRHLDIHSSEKKYQCKICSKGFSQPQGLKTHLDIHSSEKKYQCKICSKRFSQSQGLNAHLNIHRNEKKHQCKICCKRFSYLSNLKRHAYIHSSEKKFQCKICSKIFSQSSHLKTHLDIHSSEKKYQCKICSKRFAQYPNLKKHLDIHSSEKKYQCKICSKRFSQPNGLKAHLDIHSSEKKYQCKICSKRFSQLHGLKTHLDIHSSEKKYHCKICSKRFAQSHGLTKHLLVHSGETEYNCAHCSEGFIIRSHLICHLCKHH